MAELFPTAGRVVIQTVPKEEKIGNIIVPITSRNKPDRGYVRKAHADSDYKVGDLVLFPDFTGAEVEVDGESFLIVEEKCLLAKIV